MSILKHNYGNCPICLEILQPVSKYTINKEKKICITKSCGHIFHKNCYFRWREIKNTCPLCRCNHNISPDLPKDILL